MPKIVAIVGSPRPNGNTNYLVDQALAEARLQGIEAEKIELAKYTVNPCLGHENCSSFDTCRQQDDGAWIIERFRTADGVLLATPVYYYDVTAQMKAFIDRNYFLFRHGLKRNARSVGLIIVAGGAGIDPTEQTLRRFAGGSSRGTHGQVHVVAGYASRPGDVKTNLALVEQSRELGRTMANELLG